MEAKRSVKELVIDPNELREGACHIRDFLGGKFAICKDSDGKIRIYEVEE